MRSSLMYADEPGVRVEKIKLDVPAARLQDVNGDGPVQVMWRCRVLMSPTAFDELHDCCWRNLTCRQQVLHINVSPSLMLVVARGQCMQHQLLGFAEMVSWAQNNIRRLS